MSPEEFKEAMQAILVEAAGKEDLEDTHHKADDLLCKILVDLGYSDGVDLFKKLDKWYA